MQNKPKQISIRPAMFIGILLCEIDAWTNIYEFSFQFWGSGNNNVFINRGGVEVASHGRFETTEEALEWTREWIYKANPGSRQEINPNF